MNVIKTEIPDILLIEPDVYPDQRGYFFETWNEDRYKKAGINCNWMQDNESKSFYGVIRGLHYQKPPYTQAKLIRVITGTILDTILDIRKGSLTFGKYISVELSGDNKRQLFIPRGFAHGFSVLSDVAVIQYKCDNLYMPSHECGIRFDDPKIGIDWKIPSEKIIVSPKDLKQPLLANAELIDFNSDKQ